MVRTHGSTFRAEEAFTLVELLIVVAIISFLAAILFPVFARARANGVRTSCINNLKQIGLGIAMYRSDFDGYNPHHRFCPDVAGDETCSYQDPTPTTGPNEIWWAPFDPSVATNATALTSNFKDGFLFPYVKTYQIFKCPADKQWQCGYAMSYVTDGPMGKNEAVVVNPGALYVWDHAKTPGCADTQAAHHTQGTDWVPFPASADTAHTHYPFRHLDGFVALRVDGGVKFRRPDQLTVADFTATS